MPFLIKIYTFLFIGLLISNIIFHIRYGMKHVFIVYEFLSAAYIVFMIVAYWNPFILEKLDFVCVMPLILILIVDIYFSIWGKVEDLGLKIPGFSKHEQETAKVISILFTAPAYIIGLLLVFELISTHKILLS